MWRTDKCPSSILEVVLFLFLIMLSGCSSSRLTADSGLNRPNDGGILIDIQNTDEIPALEAHLIIQKVDPKKQTLYPVGNFVDPDNFRRIILKRGDGNNQGMHYFFSSAQPGTYVLSFADLIRALIYLTQ